MKTRDKSAVSFTKPKEHNRLTVARGIFWLHPSLSPRGPEERAKLLISAPLGQRSINLVSMSVLALLAALTLMQQSVAAQNPEIQQRLAEMKENSAKNKQNLATYTWQEQKTISVKGEVKKQETFQVHMGPDSKPQKTPLNAAPAPAQPSQAGGGRRGGRLKEKVVENKKEEYKEYGEKISALAQSYAPPDQEKLQEAFKKGNIKLTPGAAPDQVQLVITNYLKPNDSMTITLNKEQKAMQSVQIASYMDSPSDVVKIAVQFSKLADGTNHIAAMTVDGVSKQLKVDVQNSNYKKM